jgi:MFS family permease
VSFAVACIDSIWAIYIDSFIDNVAVVGFISSFLAIVAFFASILFVPIIEKRDKLKLYSFSLFVYMIAFILFSFNNNFYLVVLLSFFLTLAYSLKISCFGLLVRDNSDRSRLARNEGVIYTAINISYLVAPLIAAYVLSKFGFRYVFFLAAFFIFLGMIFFRFSKIWGGEIKNKIDGDVIKNFFVFFKNGDRLISYFISMGITAWWALIYVFIPLMITRSGIGVVWVGYFLFATVIPVVLLEYYFSKWAGKHGFKKIFKIGYMWVAVFSVLCFFSTNVYLTLLLLILANIGIAMLEPTTEAYFFDILKKNQQYRFYGPYNTAVDSGSFVGKISASILLVFLPFKFVFLLFGAFMFGLFLLSFKAKSIIESRRK